MPWFRRHKPSPKVHDTLFGMIEGWQGDQPWGHLLDAGTGEHSLRWIMGLETRRWTAVTGGQARQEELQQELGPHMRASGRVLTGNWRDPAFLQGERFDTVLADYLLGALDGFAPYFQDRLFARLRPHVGGRLYAVGLEPYGEGGGEAGELVREIAALRDACILLAGHRCYREYPLDWVLRSLEGSGYRVLHADSVPIVYRERFIDGQLDVCLRKLPLFPDAAVADALRGQVEELRARAKAACRRQDGLRFGADWVVAAECVSLERPP